MKVITCVSFHGTGSGAVDDFFREFDNCPCAPSEFECRFLQDPDGISDLEYNLIDNRHRLNSGFALKRYLKFVNNYSRTYKKIFGDKWIEYSNEYVQSLISNKYKGYWHGDILLLNPIDKFIYYVRRGINKILPKKLKKSSYYNYFPNIDYFHSYISKREFIEKTQKYCNKLCSALNKDEEGFVLLDQLIPTSNMERYISYVENLKVIVVDRDPRDLYINQIRNGSHVLPKDPEIFAKVYKDQREMMGEFSGKDSILRVQFEDLIYDYDNTTKKIMEFVGQEERHHIKKKKYFDPSRSIKNTKLWILYPEYEEAANKIAKLLPGYLYNFT